MSEQILEQSVAGTEQAEQLVDNTAYIEAIREMKKNSVDRAKYDALQEDNKRLLTALTNGQSIDITSEKEEPKDLGELLNKFRKAETTLDGVSAALEYRDEVLKRGGTDPFLPVGKKILATEEDIAAANRVAEGFKHCVEYAEGDPYIFANELARITVDNGPVRKKKR